eukprot:Platyproteum_vivax@DN5671_c0_g1_i1.p1
MTTHRKSKKLPLIELEEPVPVVEDSHELFAYQKQVSTLEQLLQQMIGNFFSRTELYVYSHIIRQHLKFEMDSITCIVVDAPLSLMKYLEGEYQDGRAVEKITMVMDLKDLKLTGKEVLFRLEYIYDSSGLVEEVLIVAGKKMPHLEDWEKALKPKTSMEHAAISVYKILKDFLGERMEEVALDKQLVERFIPGKQAPNYGYGYRSSFQPIKEEARGDSDTDYREVRRQNEEEFDAYDGSRKRHVRGHPSEEYDSLDENEPRRKRNRPLPNAHSEMAQASSRHRFTDNRPRKRGRKRHGSRKASYDSPPDSYRQARFMPRFEEPEYDYTSYEAGYPQPASPPMYRRGMRRADTPHPSKGKLFHRIPDDEEIEEE